MSNGSDETLDRIAQSLEGIALAFLGPREAFTKVDSGQLKGVIEKVLNEIWAPVKSELEKFKSSSGASSTLAAPVRGGSPTLATPVRGGQAAFFPGSGIPGDIVIQVGGVITFFDARAEARSRLIKLLPPVEAEIRFLCPLRIALKDTDTEPISTLCTSLSDTAVNFDPDKAQEVQEVYLARLGRARLFVVRADDDPSLAQRHRRYRRLSRRRRQSRHPVARRRQAQLPARARSRPGGDRTALPITHRPHHAADRSDDGTPLSCRAAGD